MWKDIEGYEELYMVSDIGEVKSLPKNHRYGSKVERILKSGKTKKQRAGEEYPTVMLSKDGVVREYKIHRLVASAFIDNPLNKSEVNHRNGLKNDNRVENLEWVTPKENSQHAWNTGLSRVSDKMKQVWKSNIGRKHSEETKLKISKKHLGKVISEETKLKISNTSKGRTHSQESKEKMKQKQLGKLLSNESKEKISKANKGNTAWNKGMTKKQQNEYRIAKENTTRNLVGIFN